MQCFSNWGTQPCSLGFSSSKFDFPFGNVKLFYKLEPGHEGDHHLTKDLLHCTQTQLSCLLWCWCLSMPVLLLSEPNEKEDREFTCPWSIWVYICINAHPLLIRRMWCFPSVLLSPEGSRPPDTRWKCTFLGPTAHTANQKFWGKALCLAWQALWVMHTWVCKALKGWEASGGGVDPSPYRPGELKEPVLSRKDPVHMVDSSSVPPPHQPLC
jgi:hypothetical protein